MMNLNEIFIINYHLCVNYELEICSFPKSKLSKSISISAKGILHFEIAPPSKHPPPKTTQTHTHSLLYF